jgi:hypothetical protein
VNVDADASEGWLSRGARPFPASRMRAVLNMLYLPAAAPCAPCHRSRNVLVIGASMNVRGADLCKATF